jgi:hypothetical protein
MYKKFMLKCDILNAYKGIWHNENFYFDTKEEMEYFVKHGTEYIKPNEIKIEAAFELKKIENPCRM